MTELQTAATELADTVNAYLDLMPPALALKLGPQVCAVFSAASPLRMREAAARPPRCDGKPYLRLVR